LARTKKGLIKEYGDLQKQYLAEQKRHLSVVNTSRDKEPLQQEAVEIVEMKPIYEF